MKEITRYHLENTGYGKWPLLHFNGHSTPVGLGESDNHRLYAHDNVLILLSSNCRHGYAGIDIYTPELDSGGQGIFIQNCNDGFSPVYSKRRDFFDLAYINQARQLLHNSAWYHGLE